MTTLERRLGVPGAIVVGLCAMLGAGVFFVWTPAAFVAGEWLWLALVLAAVVAIANALSTAQLAMRHPVSGGGYAYARAELSPTAGFAAGWLFLTGKTCSAAAIALVAASHLWPGWEQPVAIAAVVVLALLNAQGIRTTAWVSWVVVSLALAGIATAVVWSVVAGPQVLSFGWTAYAPLSDEVFVTSGGQTCSFGGIGGSDAAAAACSDVGALATPPGPLAVLQGAGLLFFAFAGYARMATLGEEVRDPRRTLPIAILGALGIVLALYALVAWATTTAYADALVWPETPVASLVTDPIAHRVLLTIGAIACLGSLMGILAGLSRTSLAMARDGELPGVLARISPRTHAPAVAEGAMAVLAIALVLVAPPVLLVALSSTSVLAYYAIGHVGALRMRRAAPEESWVPRWVSILGLALCTLLVVTLPWYGVVASALWLGIALAIRAIRRRTASR
ncbi:APC family permease [Agrococcus jejuensis]|uniref:Amino acid/polyamine/organocation transporter, APC superfamily n=1 Tax=Agrococcus jejuensis TaxID=399736 RepID=A0A1G8FKR9_9MICO|nr:APC family permease [Agrococcus jejuensis]SDH82750.1 amino acid/polyamine/organocation transporter, APC superfamily [Agrococcus jejuensis]